MRFHDVVLKKRNELDFILGDEKINYHCDKISTLNASRGVHNFKKICNIIFPSSS
jgi:hypothetical protein